MIYVCPFCGRRISRAINNGITTCNNCHRVFDSSSYHRILSAAWSVRQDNISDLDAIKLVYELNDCEAQIVKKYVIDDTYSHDELLKVVNQKTCIDCV